MDEQRKEKIGRVDDYHRYLAENEYIFKGYRINFNSTSKIFRSMFLLHNETVNIWTHLIGFAIFLILLLVLVFSTDFSADSTYYREYISTLHQEFNEKKVEIGEKIEQIKIMLDQTLYPLAITITKTLESINLLLDDYSENYNSLRQEVKQWPLYVFIFSALVCLFFSTTYHLFNAYSINAKIVSNKLDYAGISILICGSFFPPVYYIFYCHQEFVIFYLSGITIFSALSLVLSMYSKFQEPEYRRLRGLAFLVLGLLGVFPVFHMTFL